MKTLIAILATVMSFAYSCHVAMAATATGQFNFDFASDPACSATVTTDCIDHFEVWDITTGSRKLATIAMPSNPANPIQFSFKVGPPYGNRTWSAVAVAKDGTTSDMQAPAAQKVIAVRPGAPASFVVNLN